MTEQDQNPISVEKVVKDLFIYMDEEGSLRALISLVLEGRVDSAAVWIQDAAVEVATQGGWEWGTLVELDTVTDQALAKVKQLCDALVESLRK